MELVANRTNLCSEEFIEQTRQQLLKVRGVIAKIDFENQLKAGKSSPIDFGLLEEETLALIEGLMNKFKHRDNKMIGSK